jgi:tRNA-modifying protein YgfZ
VEIVTPTAVRRARDFVGVRGPDAADYLERMLSNEVESLSVGESRPALLLTAKARVIAPVVVWRRAEDDFLLLTEPGVGETLRTQLLRTRFAARCEIEREEHTSVVVFGGADGEGVPNDEYGVPAIEVLDADEPDAVADEQEVERLRILARRPRWGREIDDRVLPAEAGLVERAVSLTKGCYPGQEPVARLQHRGHANRGLRVLALEAQEIPPFDAEVRFGEKAVGRVTSAARARDDRVYALAYVRVEVPDDAQLVVEGAAARSLD